MATTTGYSMKLYRFGYQAAMHGESRRWVAEYGEDALRGYDAYWAEVEA